MQLLLFSLKVITEKKKSRKYKLKRKRIHVIIGTSYTAPKHLPFKDGISWASFEYLEQLATRDHGPRSVSIIPVGITYSTKNRWRSEAVVE